MRAALTTAAAARPPPPQPGCQPRGRRAPCAPRAPRAAPLSRSLHAQPGAVAARAVPDGKKQQTFLDLPTMAATYDALADRALTLLAALPPPARLVIGVAGPPGAGKSTLAAAVVARLQTALTDPAAAVALPMDGFHLTKAQLAAFPDPAAAFARRGAPHTFDGAAFVAAVRSVARAGSTATLPSFDHGVGDPTPGGVVVPAAARIIVVEGNYLFLDQPPWSSLLDDRILRDAWYVDVGAATTADRLFARQTGDGVDPEVSRGRIEGNDAPNAELVARFRGRADVVVAGERPLE